jgi:hypothetical protein
MPNYRATLDGLDMHLIHAPAGEHALPPLLLLLGYPSTPFAQQKEISRLVEGPSALPGQLSSASGRGPVDPWSRPRPQGLHAPDMRTGPWPGRRSLMAELGCERLGICAYDIGASVAAYLSVGLRNSSLDITRRTH